MERDVLDFLSREKGTRRMASLKTGGIMRKIYRTINCVLVLFVASCVTVNVYFPAAAVQKAADEIVEDVRSKGETPAPAPKPGPSSWLKERLEGLSIGPRPVYAEVNINVSTPAIRALKDSIKNRFGQLKPFYDKGALGENNMGLLEVRDTAALSLPERGQATNLAQQENKDRQALYTEIATANKLGTEAVPEIQKIFANSWRDQSQAGWWVQNNAGAWAKK
jgi:uncharacterized protein